MPVRVDSAVWENGAENEVVLYERVRQFLRERSELAFRPRELSDELLGTRWGSDEELDAMEMVSQSIRTNRLTTCLDELADEGEVEIRGLPHRETDTDVGGQGEVAFATYSGE